MYRCYHVTVLIQSCQLLILILFLSIEIIPLGFLQLLFFLKKINLYQDLFQTVHVSFEIDFADYVRHLSSLNYANILVNNQVFNMPPSVFRAHLYLWVK